VLEKLPATAPGIVWYCGIELVVEITAGESDFSADHETRYEFADVNCRNGIDVL
jgi:hypothetical protein